MALITKKEAAERLTISVRTLEGMISRGAIPACRIGPKLVRIEEADLDAYLAAHRIVPQPKEQKPAPRPCRYVPGMRVV